MNTQRRVVLKKSKDGLQDVFNVEENVRIFLSRISMQKKKINNISCLHIWNSVFLLYRSDLTFVFKIPFRYR